MMTFKYAIYYTMQTVKKLWHAIDLKHWSKKIGGSSAQAVLAAFYFIIAFGVGYFFRRHLKFMLASLIVSIIMLKVLEHNGFVKVDWASIYIMLGMGPSGDFGLLITNSFIWVKNNVIVFVAAMVGFLLGVKLG